MARMTATRALVEHSTRTDDQCSTIVPTWGGEVLITDAALAMLLARMPESDRDTVLGMTADYIQGEAI